MVDLKLNGGVYDVLKPIATTVLPGLGALYFTLAQIWELPKGEEVVGTIAAINVFLGLILTLSSVSDAKYDGVIDVDDASELKTVYTLELSDGPESLLGKKHAFFKVNKR